MPNFNLYVTTLSSDRQEPDSNQQETLRNLASQGLLGQDESALESISTDPGTVSLRGQIIGRYAELIAAELKELADSSGYAIVPVNVPGEKTAADGYYSVEDMSIGAVHESLALAQEYDGSLSKAGTRRSHYRAVETTPRQADHPWGTDTTAEIGIPATASDVQWVNPSTNASEPASSTATRNAEHGDVDVYQVTDASFYSVGDKPGPVLVYDVGYDAIGPIDVRVWDRRGYASRDDDDGIPRWAKVFVSTHDYGDDAAVIENGLLRLTFDTSADPGFAVETWDDANTTWTATSLDTSGNGADWQLLAIDIGHRQEQTLAPDRVDALTRWTNTADGSTYALDMTLHRGQDAVQFARLPDADSPVPSGLETLLSPIASTSILHSQSTQTLRPRSEVDA